MPRKAFSDNDIIVLCSEIARYENISVNSLRNSSKGSVKKQSSFSEMLRNVKKKAGMKKKQKSEMDELDEEKVAGLQGREISAVAILVNKDGVPIKSYTEKEDIPSEEIESAENVFVSRVPLPAQDLNEKSKGSENANPDEIGDELADYLSDVFVQKKFIRRMEKLLMRLHTTDLNTARSFLKSERYANVRQSIKTELINFIKKDLKNASST